MRKIKLTVTNVVLVLFALALLITNVFSLSKIKDLNTQNEKNVTTLENTLLMNKRVGYLAARDIKAGEVLSESLLIYSTNIISDITPNMFVDSTDFGKVVSSPITMGMPVYRSNVLASSGENLRERECSFIWLNTNLQNYDFVDVRILFPNGEDYIIAAKKIVYDLRIGINNVFLHLTEEEIQLLDSAIVDANMHDARIYVTKYTQPEIQEASVITYSPSSDVMRVIAKDPNIVDRSEASLSVDARSAMDKRLQLFEEAYPDFKLLEEIGGNSRYDASLYTNGNEVSN